MPYVTVEHGPGDNPVYKVGGKSFVFFRNRRPDAADPITGERYDDVIVFWVPSESDKQALVQDPISPFFTTAHFDGHLSVLVRASRLGELTRDELAEVVQDAWLSRASPKRAGRGPEDCADLRCPTRPAIGAVRQLAEPRGDAACRWAIWLWVTTPRGPSTSRSRVTARPTPSSLRSPSASRQNHGPTGDRISERFTSTLMSAAPEPGTID